MPKERKKPVRLTYKQALTILRLPPGLFAVWFKGGDNVFYPVINGVVDWVVWPSGVTLKTFLLLLRKDRITSNDVVRKQRLGKKTGPNKSQRK